MIIILWKFQHSTRRSNFVIGGNSEPGLTVTSGLEKLGEPIYAMTVVKHVEFHQLFDAFFTNL